MAHKIKELRQSFAMTQSDLANRLGVTTSAVGMYETGARNPSYDILIKLSQIFKVPLEQIVDLATETPHEEIDEKPLVKLTELSYQKFHLEYIHPQKIRAKIKKDLQLPTVQLAQQVQRAFQYLLSDSSFHHPDMKELAKKALLKDESYRGITISPEEFPFAKESFIDGIVNLFYEDIKGPKEKSVDFIEQKIKLPVGAPKVILLGKVGVGKSTIIKNITNFGPAINFPFTDTSRTTTYQTEYIFKKARQQPHKLALSFMSYDEIVQEVESAIDRAVEAKIDLFYEEEYEKPEEMKFEVKRPVSEEDRILRAFYSDPNKILDFRFFMGKYYRQEFRLTHATGSGKTMALWATIYRNINKIMKEVKTSDFTSLRRNSNRYNNIPSKNMEYLRHKYYEYVLESSVDNYSTYSRLLSHILTEIKLNVHNILTQLESNEAISSPYIMKEKNYDWPTGFACNIRDYESKDFYQFIKTFTSREGKDFGSTLTPLVKKMRLELPYNSQLDEKVTRKGIIFIDTVGTSHVVEEGSSIENSVNFNLDQVDVVTVVDDSRTSMSADSLNILKHLTNRIAKNKIFMAYTFYDDFSKKEFFDDYDDEEYVDAQKKDYLLSLQKSKVASLLQEDRPEVVKFLKQLEQKTTFLKDLIHSKSLRVEENCSALNEFLTKIQDYYRAKHNYLIVDKISEQAPLVEYDYKRLSMIFFNEILEKYRAEQHKIYFLKPPHYKVTEALTKRLTYGETYYRGAQTLKPVDDLYTIMLDNLYQFILKPKVINFKKPYAEGEEYKAKLLEKLKEVIFENLAQYLRKEFTSSTMRDRWKVLYMDYGIGSDFRRRMGIIDTLEKLLIPYRSYIDRPEEEHMVDKLELLFRSSVEKFEKVIEKERRVW
ncbi:helix-turn-helix transcriptional regulator [Heliorestis acidaminivorans]|uniref:Helix-turn-helix transcriptional regulator n=1 Tax=Heliorestis acidaminivorans TaxID=553427 RepID=A0A6I0EQI9_9FIRM|nr:helix-turn-helix transcriptional regulator [Heliorestis acidaminivorans]KAB2951636.1 helix-turn-helix transcriptional regulator [Heliorestis acidaminivorans]